jgi:hypothetical protein
MKAHGSRNGFQTNVWGPCAWFFLHIVTLNFSVERSSGYMRFFKSLGDVLPCGACRDNYKKIITSSDPKLRLSKGTFCSRLSVAEWLFRVHNRVQADIYNKTGLQKDKPLFADTRSDFKRAMGLYEKYRAKCSKTSYGCVVPIDGYKKQRCIIKVVQST